MKKILNFFISRLFIPDGNIAISCLTFEDLILKRKNEKDFIWLKHNYIDRFFADPFILNIETDFIHVLAEELNFRTNKGIIVLLKIEKKTGSLITRKVVLEEDTHLSYPFIYRCENDVYILPENSSSGNSKLYVWSQEYEKFIFFKVFSDKPLNDPTLISVKGELYCFSTIYQSNRDLYLSIVDKEKLIAKSFRMIKSSLEGSRPAGGIISYKGKLYRPTQDCSKVYGGAILFQEINQISSVSYKESETFRLTPVSRRYNIGTHHISFYKDYAVCDGYGYRFSIKFLFLRILRFIRKYL